MTSTNSSGPYVYAGFYVSNKTNDIVGVCHRMSWNGPCIKSSSDALHAMNEPAAYIFSNSNQRNRYPQIQSSVMTHNAIYNHTEICSQVT